jgi:hypothetical protein
LKQGVHSFLSTGVRFGDSLGLLKMVTSKRLEEGAFFRKK